MPLPLPHIRSYLSSAYVRAVVAQAGFAFNGTEQDYGVDGYIAEVQVFQDGTFNEIGWKFDIQVKSTIDWKLVDDSIQYDIDAKAYNKLVSRDGPTPIILALLCLPRDQMEWLSIDENHLLLRKCCYWTRITGPPISNTSSKRIFIPRNQVFGPSVISSFLEQMKNGEI